MIVTIDGVVGAGKSSVAKELAERLDLPVVNSGLIYRSVAWLCNNANADITDVTACVSLMDAMDLEFTGHEQVMVNGVPLSTELRSHTIDDITHNIARIPEIHAGVHAIQRQQAERKGAVVEGRAIGSYVFPDADVKFWLDADPKVREARIAKQRGEHVAGQMMARDHADATREHEPNVPPKGAISVDSTAMDLQEVVDLMYRKVLEAAA